MAKKKPSVEIHSYGLYERWDRKSRSLPELMQITTEIEAKLDMEFGYVLRIRNARNSRLTFRIDHPPFPDASGAITPPFEGEMYVKTNDYRFFLGDTVWTPIENKRGAWRLMTWLDGVLAADKTIRLL